MTLQMVENEIVLQADATNAKRGSIRLEGLDGNIHPQRIENHAGIFHPKCVVRKVFMLPAGIAVHI